MLYELNYTISMANTMSTPICVIRDPSSSLCLKQFAAYCSMLSFLNDNCKSTEIKSPYDMGQEIKLSVGCSTLSFESVNS